MSEKIKKIGPDEAILKALELFEANKRVPLANANHQTERPALPIIVGAGISVSAGVPLNAALLAEISRQNGNDESLRSYEDIYSKIEKGFSEKYGAESFIKSDLRHWLVDAGIPRLKDQPLPNLANLLTIHLVINNILGPVISLNVDPLLQISTSFYLDRLANPVKFIQNSSQFSDLIRDNPGSNKYIYQPHGTIEEPLSLRFRGDELIDRENDLRLALVNAVKERVGLITLGVNIEDSVAVQFIRSWIESNPTRQLSLLVTCHGSIKEAELNNLQKFWTEYNYSNIEVYYCENVDSDEFLTQLSEAAIEKSVEFRAMNEALYHVPPISEVLIQKLVFDALSDQLGRGISAGKPFDRLPEPQEWISLAIGMLAISSRGPLSIGELARYCAEFKAFKEITGRIDRIKDFNNALSKLFRNKVLCLHGRAGEAVSDVDIINYDSIDDVEKIMIIRNPELKTVEAYSHRLFNDVLSIDPNYMDEICKIISKIELEREMNFDFKLGMSSNIFFKGSRLIPSHQELDYELDSLKNEFLNVIKSKGSARCMVITESGEHLFRNDKLRLIGSVSEIAAPDFDLEAVVRDWIAGVLNDDAIDKISLSIIVAETDRDWLFERAERAERDEIISALLGKLVQSPNIDVTWLPWDKHNDHMWLLDRGSGGQSKGVLFPRRHGEQAYFGLRVEGDENVNKLVGVFERHKRESKPLNVQDVYHVAALTIVDKSYADLADHSIARDDKILMGVRNPETNTQHADIACVPTKRIPIAVFRDIVDQSFTISSRSDSREILDVDWTSNDTMPGHDPVTDVVEGIMARKLGLSDALERGKIKFRATPKIVKAGVSPLYSPDDVPEHVAMLNILVFLSEGKEHFVKETASYSTLSWIDVGEFLDALDGNAEGMISLGGNENTVPYKCGGVCVCTTEALAASIVEPIHISEGIAV